MIDEPRKLQYPVGGLEFLEDAGYVLNVLGIIAETWGESIVTLDDYDIWWHNKLRRFMVNCNDWFAYACADCETIEPDELELFRESMQDAADVEEWDWGLRLFACRKRKRPPMDCWFKSSGYPYSTSFVPDALEIAFRVI